MEKVYNSQGILIFLVDDEFLYYRSQIDSNEIFPDDSIRLSQLDIDNNGPFKLLTLLQFLEETEVIDSVDEIMNDIIRDSATLGKLIRKYQEQIAVFDNRVVLHESESSGPASAWRDYLYLTEENQFFTLNSSRKGLQSASEIIEYYGFGDNDYWDQIQANGEFIVESILVRNGKDLFDAIALAFENEEQWNGMNDVIDWATIVDVLLDNKSTLKLGIELKSLFTNELN
jgi:hypothetical protein